jgi:hypothetical protein
MPDPATAVLIMLLLLIVLGMFWIFRGRKGSRPDPAIPECGFHPHRELCEQLHRGEITKEEYDLRLSRLDCG